MGFGRSPKKCTGGRIDTCAGRRAHVETKTQSLRGHIRIGSHRDKGQCLAFIDGFVSNREKRWCGVHFVHSDGDRFEIIERGRPVVGHANRHGKSSRPLVFGGRPGEQAANGIDDRAGRSARIQTVGQALT